jgi:hypothetical protein
VNPARRRADGAVLSRVDLAEAVPMMLDELDDIARLVDLVEQWLLLEQAAYDLFTDWLIASTPAPRGVATAQDVLDQLGTLSVKLHALLRPGIPDTGHIHPPAG